MTNPKIQIGVEADVSKADEGLTQITKSASKMASAVGKAGKDAGDSMGKIGDGGSASAAKVEASTRNMIGAIQRTTAALEAGKKSGSEYYEALAKQRGVDVGALRPYLAQLDAVTAKQEAAARSAEFASKAFLAIGAAIGIGAVGFVRMVDGAIEAADNMRDLSKTTGLAVEQLAGLQLAAKQSGGDLDGIAKSINKLSMNIGKDGEKFRALGISAKDPIEAFKQLSDIFSSIEDPQRRAALGAAALGKSWESAAPLMSEGSKSIGEMIEKGTRLSGITGDMTDEADKFKDSMAELTARVDGFKTKVAGDMLPALNQMVPAITLAYEESGKLAALWASMGALGTFLFTNEFDSSKVKIKALNEEIAKLEDYKKNPGLPFMTSWLYGTEAEWNARISAAKKEVEALIDLTKPREQSKPKETAAQTAASKEFIKAQKEQTDAAESAAKSAEKSRASFVKSLEKEAATYGMTATQSKLYEAALLGIKGKQLDQIKITLSGLDAKKKESEAEKKALEIAKEQAKTYQALADERLKIVDAANAEALKNEELAATYGMSKDAIEELTLARLEDRLSQRLSLDLSEEDVQQTEKLIAAKKRSIAALREIGGKEAAKKQFDNLAAESQKFTDGLYQGLSDALMRGAEAGKSFFQNFWESIKNLFKTTVLKMTVQVGMGGVTGTAAGSAGASGLNQLGSMASTGNSIYGTIAGGVGSIGSGIGYVGGAFGSTTLSAFGSGMSGTAAGTFAGQGMTVAGSSTGMGALAGNSTAAAGASTGAMAATAATIAAGVIAGVYGGRAVSGGYSTGGSGNSMVNGGTAIGAGVGAVLGGPFGAALGAALGGVIGGGVNRLFGHKAKVYGAETIAGMLGTDNFTSSSAWTQKGGYFRSDKSGVVSSAADAAVRDNLNGGYEALKKASADYAKALGINAESIATRTDQISFSVGKSEEEAQKNIAAALAGIGEKIAADLLGAYSTLRNEGETASAALVRLGTNLSGVNGTMDALGLAAYSLSVEGAKGADALVNLFGGLDKLQAASASYYANYYSDAEKLAYSTEQVSKAFATAGLVMPETREALRAMVEAAKAAGNDTAYASLIKLSESFAAVVPASNAAALAIQAIADAATKAKAVAAESYSLESELLKAQGNTQALRLRELSLLDESNRSKKQAIFDLEDSIKLSEQSAKKQAEQQEIVSRIGDSIVSGFDAQEKALQSSIEKRKEEARAIESFKASIFSGANSPLTAAEAYQNAKANLSSATPANIQSAVNDFLQASKAISGSSLEYAQNVGYANAALSGVADQSAAGIKQDQAALSALPEQMKVFWDAVRASGALPSFAVGTNYVTQDGAAMIHKGERIMPAADNALLMARLGSPSDNNVALVEEIRQLRAELEAQNVAIAQNTSETAKIMRRWEGGGMPTTRATI